MSTFIVLLIKYIMSLHTVEFDKQLKDRIPHLNNYPELLPFVGSKWNETKYKFLFIAESHYIDERAISKSHQSDWYNFTTDDFLWKGYIDSINTRYNVLLADDLSIKGFNKPYVHYYNIKRVIKENLNELKNEELIFQNFAYYNYFQRPAYQETESIINNQLDDDIAFNTIKVLIETIKPEKIIFLSGKAFNSFFRSVKNNNEIEFEKYKHSYVPHPGSAWWNRQSKNYGKLIGTEINRTGRERFIDLITSKI